MNKRFRNIFSVILSVIVLVSSNGIVLASHSCISKHETEVSVFRISGCCSKDKTNCHSRLSGEIVMTKKCCQLNLTFHRVDVSSPVYKIQPVRSFKMYAKELVGFPVSVFFSEEAPFSFIKITPVIQSGSSFLHSIRLLRI
jgi:hypothetical protein